MSLHYCIELRINCLNVPLDPSFLRGLGVKSLVCLHLEAIVFVIWCCIN